MIFKLIAPLLAAQLVKGEGVAARLKFEALFGTFRLASSVQPLGAVTVTE